ncbi:ABC-type transport system substrate-binding protein [Thiogranum longum]|uniref:ABC-type transport system substrate-binding protein n=1 Tax=Thiogranum longum TaxID=1537524 RepID=A0A4R1HB29_9GAMM|nr:ABC transporter substrate-binding protein [Thiogranum longum]TCK17801.1 ABC-type transport system substrate-binding protein [Thiogranum longum]
MHALHTRFDRLDGFLRGLGWFLVSIAVTACGDQPWNSPYPPDQAGKNILYSSFSARPKHLDPAQSYSSNEVVFTGQIYEPPLQYHFLKRPYQLEPLTVSQMPEPYYLDEQGNRLSDDAADTSIAYSVYDIEIKPGIRYQPHPAFAKHASGAFVYHDLDITDSDDFSALADFPLTGSRELVAADYVYEIKRLAHPHLHSPIFGLMADYIVGLEEYAVTLQKAVDEGEKSANAALTLKLDDYPLKGATVLDRYRYRITVRGKYPQFRYWLAMPFFAPVPWEADVFYNQPGMKERNITLDWYPVGTGPYMLTVNDPNRQMVMERNPNFRGEVYPDSGEPADMKAGFLEDAGRNVPFIDQVIYSLEKEAIPTWNKFLQGYYDASGVSSDSFDQAIQVGGGGSISLTPELQAKGIHLNTAVSTSIYYTGFNMVDPVVGGNSERARLLRHAIAIAMDYEEYISIFANGRGIPAQSPLPPGIFGFREGKEGVNPWVYDWTPQGPKRKSIEAARRLLAEAGYPDGRDVKTGKPLVLYLDATGGGPDDSARQNWIRKQFNKLDIQLQIRNTDYNRFQDKMLKGTAQIFQWGWNADYPDPENFLFLLYGKNAKFKKNGENAANYSNPEYDRLFDKMKNMPNGPARQAIIDRMVDILRRDAPWVFGFHPKQFVLYHDWYFNAKPNLMANNTLKYKRIDPVVREQKRREWNKPIVWPLGLMGLLLVLMVIPAVIGYRRHENRRMLAETDR